MALIASDRHRVEQHRNAKPAIEVGLRCHVNENSQCERMQSIMRSRNDEDRLPYIHHRLHTAPHRLETINLRGSEIQNDRLIARQRSMRFANQSHDCRIEYDVFDIDWHLRFHAPCCVNSTSDFPLADTHTGAVCISRQTFIHTPICFRFEI